MKKTTQQFATEIYNKYGLILTSEYKGAHNIVTFLCENNHENEAMATNLLQRGYKCKECLLGRKVISRLEWTDNNKLLLQEYLELGLSTEEIAEKFRVPLYSIHNAVAKFKDIVRLRSMRTKPKLLSILASQGRTLISDYTDQSVNVRVKCKKGHIVHQTPSNILSKGTGCPDCFRIEPSKAEKELKQFIEDNYEDWIVYNDRKILGGKELDIVLPDIGLAFEYNGSFWHSDIKVGNNYHKGKTEGVEDFGYSLIHVGEYDWTVKKEAVKSRIQNILKPASVKNISIQAITVEEAKSFIHTNSIVDVNDVEFAFGAYTDKLVAVIAFNQDNELINYTYIEKISNLLNDIIMHAEVRLPRTIIAKVDRNYCYVKDYLDAGFSIVEYTEPNFAYFKKGAEKFVGDIEEIKNDARWYKVYDSGQTILSLSL